MRIIPFKLKILFTFILLLPLTPYIQSFAAEDFADILFSQGRETNLPIPRFTSLKSNEANVRTGPGQDHPIAHKYIIKNFPLKIIDEYKEWRKVEDIQGDTGWLHKILLSSKRTAYVIADRVNLYSDANDKSSVKAIMNKGIILLIDSCKNQFCKVTIDNNELDFSGYVQQDMMWGAVRDI